MFFKGNKSGFTMAEVVVSVGIFAMATVIASSIVVTTVQMEKKNAIQETLYEEARNILSMLTEEIQKGTIDYEEYFSIKVVQEGKADENTYYGVYRGVYGSRFYDPGKSYVHGGLTFNPDDLGVECSVPNEDALPEDCEVFYSPSTDLNTGQNPFTGTPTDSNALCDNISSCDSTSNIVDELYLIDNTGTKKTILGRKKIMDTLPDYAIGLLRMTGIDTDQNGVVDIFTCLPEYNCAEESDWENALSDLPPTVSDRGIELAPQSDLTDADFSFESVSGTKFMPITPLDINVSNLKFIINPLEDPYKAYAEPEMQIHPTVTILITLDLSSEAKKNYPGTFTPITVQTTVAAGVVSNIATYPPTNDLQWLRDLNIANIP